MRDSLRVAGVTPADGQVAEVGRGLSEHQDVRADGRTAQLRQPLQRGDSSGLRAAGDISDISGLSSLSGLSGSSHLGHLGHPAAHIR